MGVRNFFWKFLADDSLPGNCSGRERNLQDAFLNNLKPFSLKPAMVVEFLSALNQPSITSKQFISPLQETITRSYAWLQSPAVWYEILPSNLELINHATQKLPSSSIPESSLLLNHLTRVTESSKASFHLQLTLLTNFLVSCLLNISF